MASETDIANSALIDMGEPEINSLDQIASRASAIRAVFEGQRDWLLEQHPWNFAKARACLAPVLEPPLYGYAKAFRLPSDFLALISTEPELADYRQEAGLLLCDVDALSINYTRRVANPDDMPPSFREALAALIGSKVAKKITGSDDARVKLEGFFKDRLRTAKSLNAKSSGQEEPDRPDLFIRARGA
ncbi:MAG: hypothetical protein C0405_14660 [Desulfovibrio sp.]|nr:hypothetical protein [Desulfovibrio sp.]